MLTILVKVKVIALLFILMHGNGEDMDSVGVSAQVNFTMVKTDQELLLEHLFTNRPLVHSVIPKGKWNDSRPLEILIDTIVFNVNDIDTSQEELNLNLWFSMKWRAENLRWNSSKFGIKQIFIPSEKIWTPTLLMPSSIGLPTFSAPGNMTVLVSDDGSCVLNFVSSRKLECDMKACMFPADEHNCRLIVILYDYTMLQAVMKPYVDTNLRKILLSNGTGTWSLKMSGGQRGSFKMPNLKDSQFSLIAYQLTLSRRSRYYNIIVLLPTLLIVISAVCSMMLPADSGDRLSLLVTSLLALVVYLDVAFRYLPESSDYTPAIAAWLITVMAFLTGQIALVCLATRYSVKADKGETLNVVERILIVYVLGSLTLIYCFEHLHKVTRNRKRRKALGNTGVIYTERSQGGEVYINTIENKERNGKGDVFALRNSNTDSHEGSENNQESISGPEMARKAVTVVDTFSSIITLVMCFLSIAFFYIIFNRKSFEGICVPD